jgi:hypothetical protein
VWHLASLLWRLRRIIAIETDLFRIQAEILRDRRNAMTTLHGNLSNQEPEALSSLTELIAPAATVPRCCRGS